MFSRPLTLLFSDIAPSSSALAGRWAVLHELGMRVVSAVV